MNDTEQLKAVVTAALDQHVVDEQAELERIARVLDRMAHAMDLLRWCALVVLLMIATLGGIAGFNLQQTVKNAPIFNSNHIRTQTILCTRIMTTDPAPPAVIVELCEGRNG